MQSLGRAIRRGNAVISQDCVTVKEVVRRRGSTRERWRQAQRYSEGSYLKRPAGENTRVPLIPQELPGHDGNPDEVNRIMEYLINKKNEGF